MDRNVRASDADRDRTADLLRRHFAEGRLTPEEFDERLTAAFAARTYGDLADLTADLPPESAAYALPVVNRPAAPPAPKPTASSAVTPWRAQVASYVTVSLLCVLIWAIGGAGTFWPVWVIAPWGIALVGQVIRGDTAHSGRDRQRNRDGR